VIKAVKGRIVLPERPDQYISKGMNLYRFRPLPIQISHAAHVYELPLIHNDLFDRLLIAQSRIISLPLLTNDDDIRRYELDII
jgi:PIN domain nuclease of toxin-antitoxin system